MKKLSIGLAVFAGLIIAAVMGATSFMPHADRYVSSIPMVAAGVMLEVALFIYLCLIVCRKGRLSLRICSFAFHLGFFVMIGAYMADQKFGETGKIYAREGMTVSYFVDSEDRDRPLPFSLTCRDFQVSVYQNTFRPSHYKSTVLVLKDGKSLEGEIAVNSPLKIDDVTLYQDDFGIDQGDQTRIDFDVVEGNVKTLMSIFPEISDEVKIPGRGTLQVTDFSPYFALQNGRSITVNGNMMLNPAFKIKLTGDNGGSLEKWIIQNDARTHDVGDFKIEFRDYWGIEYTVLAYVRQPFQHWFYLGALLSLAGVLCWLIFWRMYRDR